MYPHYEKVKEFTLLVQKVLTTDQTMKDIYNLIHQQNDKNQAVSFYNEKGKITGYTYKKAGEYVDQFASIIDNRLGKDTKHSTIVLKLTNGPHWSEVFWAILMAGYKPVLIDARTLQDGAQNLINQSKAVAIISDDSNTYNVTKITLEDLLSGSKTSFVPEWEDELIFCSSGTTGDVKLMVYNGKNICHQLCASTDMYKENGDIIHPKSLEETKILCMLPLHHIFGFVAVLLWYNFYGANLIFPRSNAANELLGICREVGITHVYSVPLLWDSLAVGFERKLAMMPEKKQALLKKMMDYNLGKISKKEAGFAASNLVRKKVQKELLGPKVRFCISGGGYLNNKTASIINGIGYPLYNGFGMTEVGVTSVELSPSVDDRMKCTIGRPLHGVEYKVKKKSEKEKTGELFIRSPFVHVREIIGGKEQPATLDEEGYFASGDIAELDTDNRCYIRGRIKDIIINSDGENIFPDELEMYFQKINNINQLCILGVEQKGEVNQKIALVIEVPNHITDEDLLKIKADIAEVGAHLPKKTKIDEIYLSVKKLPLANNIKVKRYIVKKAIESGSKDYVNIDAKKETKKFAGFDEETIQSIVEPLRDMFSRILVLPKFKIEDDSHWINDLGGDSMNYVQLLLEAQDYFKVTIPEELYGKLTCINEFAEEIATLKKAGK